MTLPKRVALLMLALAVFVTTSIGLQLLAGMADWGPPGISPEVLPLFILALLGLPVAAAWLVVRPLRKRWTHASEKPRKPIPRPLFWTVVAGYALTTVVGIPAAQSDRDAWAVQEYKRIHASGSARMWEAHPYIRTYVAIPLLPCVILSYHEYQLDGLYGLGAFEVAVWYGVGVSQAEVWPLWIS